MPLPDEYEREGLEGDIERTSPAAVHVMKLQRKRKRGIHSRLTWATTVVVATPSASQGHTSEPLAETLVCKGTKNITEVITTPGMRIALKDGALVTEMCTVTAQRITLIISAEEMKRCPLPASFTRSCKQLKMHVIQIPFHTALKEESLRYFNNLGSLEWIGSCGGVPLPGTWNSVCKSTREVVTAKCPMKLPKGESDITSFRDFSEWIGLCSVSPSPPVVRAPGQARVTVVTYKGFFPGLTLQSHLESLSTMGSWWFTELASRGTPCGPTPWDDVPTGLKPLNLGDSERYFSSGKEGVYASEVR
eukprot:TRINITY_DN12755_c2_g1_i1.p1 TRINITY_DN12755_c2_g1~~TRINITY_DN12755_c2_g1_i1.p1  ORF type:complete len:305 (+),score=30.99 TRINITY_DN12755_c2_g1_i1:52-966(+)